MKTRYKLITSKQKFLASLCSKFMSKTYEIYQPITIDGKVINSGVRSVEQRWESIKQVITEESVASVLDIGCAEGYFTLAAARECGCSATGVDGDARRLWFATQQALLNNIMNTAFVYVDMSPEWCETMPSFDMIIFMSVLHHYLAYDGYDTAMSITKTLLAKTNKVMIFEAGYSRENLNLPGLPDMGNDPAGWYISFLKKAGAKDIKLLSESPGYDSSVARQLFAVYR